MSSMNHQDDDLMKRTVRMVAVLVGSCVVFVGSLSLVAVLVTSVAIGGASNASNGTSASDTTSSTPTPSKKTDKASPKAPAAPTADKPAGTHPI